MKPRLLDLFSGAGGAAVGYSRAGFEVVGVDINPQPHYPFEFHQADALEYCREHGAEFGAIHASPPCQEYSSSKYLRNATAHARGIEPNIRAKLIEPVREVLAKANKPWIIENVKFAPLPEAIYLCGSMFGLPIRRHRWFASSILLFVPGHCKHTTGFYNVVAGKVRGYGTFCSPTRRYKDCKGTIRKGEGFPGKAVGVKAFGIDWMTVDEMSEAIPPAYTQYIGKQLMQYLEFQAVPPKGTKPPRE